MTHTDPWRLGATFAYQVINVIVRTTKMSNVESIPVEKTELQNSTDEENERFEPVPCIQIK